MLANFYDIQSRRGELPIGLADIHNFELRECGQIDCEVILQNPHISLYSLDFNQQHALISMVDFKVPNTLNLASNS